MIAAIYPRTSLETDDRYSVSAQVTNCRAYAELHNLYVPEEYIFREDHTGKALDRPEYSKIRLLIRERKIHAVIIAATDRLARKVSVGEIFLDEMFEYGVALHIVAWGAAVRNTPEDRLRFNFETTFSSFERDKIVTRTMSGKEDKASRSQLVGNSRPIYGYQHNEHKTNFVHSEYAPIAREILVSYGVNQIRSAEIANRMEDRGIKTPGRLYYEDLVAVNKFKFEAGRITQQQYDNKLKATKFRLGEDRWTLTCIYNILKNHDIYAGTYTFSLSGKTYTVSVPPIISHEEAELVRQQLEVGKQRVVRRTKHKLEFLITGRVRCGLCKHTINRSYNEDYLCYYKCSGNRARTNNRCKLRPVRQDKVDRFTREFIKELLLNPDRLFAWWESQHNQDAVDNEVVEKDIEAINKRIEATITKYHRTLGRLTDNLDEDEVAFYTRQRDDLKQLLTEYREERERLARKLVTVAVDQEVIQDFATMGREYREVLETSTDYSFWRGLLSDLDITATISEDEHGRYIEFIVFGKPRRKRYLDENGSTKPNKKGGEQRELDFSGSFTEENYLTFRFYLDYPSPSSYPQYKKRR